MAGLEIYTKNWCPYCVKAKALLNARRIDYTEIDVTADQDREQEMIERSGRRTVPQIFIGHQPVGGYDDMARLNATGELDRLLELDSEIKLTAVYDVAIIGAGPAGMSAAIYVARKNLRAVVITYDVGGQMGSTDAIANYPGFQLVSGPDLVRNFAEHADQYSIDRLIGERVEGIDVAGPCKIIKLASGKKVHARAVIIASGAFKRKLDIPGERELAGKGVVYCSTCDGPLFKDMVVAIIGGGNSALAAALEMDGIARQVYLVVRDGLSGDQILQDRVRVAERVEILEDHVPLEIIGHNKVGGISIKDRKGGTVDQLAVDGVFIEIGLFPNTSFALDLVETNERGEIRVDRDGRTGVHGIFAAGDVTDNHDKQVVVAAGEGARAALAAFNYLITQV